MVNGRQFRWSSECIREYTAVVQTWQRSIQCQQPPLVSGHSSSKCYYRQFGSLSKSSRRLDKSVDHTIETSRCNRKNKVFNNFSIDKHHHLKQLESFVTSLVIPDFQFYVGKMSKQLRCRTLTGPEKLKLFQNTSIAQLIPTYGSDDVENIQNLWDEFFQLHKLFSKGPDELGSEDITSFDMRARQWGRDYISVYQTTTVTPYIHALMNHVHEFMTNHGSILPFTQHGLEKYNDIVTK